MPRSTQLKDMPARVAGGRMVASTPLTTLTLPPRLLGRTVAALRQAMTKIPPGGVLALHTADP